MKTRQLGWIAGSVLVSVSLAAGCNMRARRISADLLLDLYNEGGIDSHQDLALTPEQVARERVVNSARRHLARAFFTQTEAASAPAGPPDVVAAWYRNPDVQAAADRFLGALVSASRSSSPLLSIDAEDPSQKGVGAAAEAPPGSVTEEVSKATCAFRNEVLDMLLPELPHSLPDACADVGKARTDSTASSPATSAEPATRVTPELCTSAPAGGAQTLSTLGKKVADVSELVGALELATLEVSHLVQEGLVTQVQGEAGLHEALAQTSAYLEGRRWRRSVRAPTLGIAIKGGGSSGPYSAGAAWRILTVMQRYAEWWDTQHPAKGIQSDEARFAIASGTSAGAVVAAAVDLFHQDRCPIDAAAATFREQYGKDASFEPGGWARGPLCKEYARRILATMFTCTNHATLYCVDSQPVWGLASGQSGLMDFVGLRQMMERHVKPPVLVNSSELLLTTVDFRWGDLYLQSDQDPSTIPLAPGAANGTETAVAFQRRNIEASFVLPFIAHPVTELWISNARRRGIYLDGGIKSEIPLLALLQRGVDRAVVIGSSPTRITPTAPQENAAEIAARYLDVSLSAVTESEWTSAIPQASYATRKVRSACNVLMRRLPSTERIPQLCAGNFARACGDTTAPNRDFERMGFFRPESVEGSAGYSFDAVQMERLFQSGAESVRQQCRALVTFLGFNGVPTAELNKWCNESPIKEENLCDKREMETARCE